MEKVSPSPQTPLRFQNLLKGVIFLCFGCLGFAEKLEFALFSLRQANDVRFMPPNDQNCRQNTADQHDRMRASPRKQRNGDRTGHAG